MFGFLEKIFNVLHTQSTYLEQQTKVGPGHCTRDFIIEKPFGILLRTFAITLRCYKSLRNNSIHIIVSQVMNFSDMIPSFNPDPNSHLQHSMVKMQRVFKYPNDSERPRLRGQGERRRRKYILNMPSVDDGLNTKQVSIYSSLEYNSFMLRIMMLKKCYIVRFFLYISTKYMPFSVSNFLNIFAFPVWKILQKFFP